MASSRNATSNKTNIKSGFSNISKTPAGETNDSIPRCSCNIEGGIIKISTNKPTPYSTIEPGSLKSKEKTVITLKEDKRGGPIVVRSNQQLACEQCYNNADLPSSSTTKPIQCINPGACDRMKFLKANSEVDSLILENTLHSAVASLNMANTFEEVEELVEMHEYSKIQRRIASFVEDKKRRMEIRAHRKQAELLARKADFTKSLMYNIAAEREEMSQMHQRLVTILEESTMPNQTKPNMAEMSRFEPVAESTRISPETNGKEVTLMFNRGGECCCKGNNT